jgi:RNA polymerase sigma-70 factor (ECF subfamily)
VDACRETALSATLYKLEGKMSDPLGFRDDLLALIPKLRDFARTLCRDPELADDLAQDALEKALSRADSFTMGTNMKAWVFLIVRNLFYSHRRRSWRSVHMDPGVIERTLVVSTSPTAGLELDELKRALSQLPDVEREVLILIGGAGLTYGEAASVTGVPLGTLKSRVSRARGHLEDIYARGRLGDDAVTGANALTALIGTPRPALHRAAYTAGTPRA